LTKFYSCFDGFVLVLCGHARFCEICANSLAHEGGTYCPVCRTTITMVMRVFLYTCASSTDWILHTYLQRCFSSIVVTYCSFSPLYVCIWLC